MKQLSILALALLSVFSAYSSGSWTIQGNAYKVDTTFHAYVGPGTTQTSLQLSGTGDLRLFYTTTDLTNQHVDVRAIKANDKVASVATVSSMAISHSNANRSYFAGVNADFFGNNMPVGTTIVDGEIYNANNGGGWDAFGIDANKVPCFGVPVVNGKITSVNAGESEIASFNTARSENYLVLYSVRAGASTGTNAYGTEVAIVPLAGETFAPGKSVKMTVTGAPVAGVGSMTVPDGGFVLSGHGTAATYLNKMKDGEIISITTNVTFDNVEKGNITQVLGGRPMILSNGVVLETQGALDHLTGLHPRTAVGFSADKKKLVMLVVDGRSSISLGVVSKALADIMKNVGCTDAMNFDGGGSTALYVKDFGILNSPSDGKERAVTNGLYLSTSTPSDQAIAQIRFADAAKKLPKYGYYTPKLLGYNKYGVLISQDVNGVVLSAPAELGSIQNGGATLFCTGTGCHALTATYNGFSTSIPVDIVTGDISFRLSNIIEDTYQGYTVEAISTINEESIPLDNKALSWWSEDTNIAKIDASIGVITGVANGVTTIHGKIDKFDVPLVVNVEKPTGRYASIDAEMDLKTWTIKLTGGTGTVVSRFENGVRIEYTGSGEGTRYPSLKLTKAIKLWSLPDEILVKINPGNAPVNTMSFTTRAENGPSKTTVIDMSLVPNEINEVSLKTADWCNVKDRATFPIKFSILSLGMGVSTEKTKYTIDIPSIEAVYYNAPVSGVENVIATKDNVITVAPNPVKAGENIIITIPTQFSKATVKLFNEVGQMLFERNEIVDNGVIQLSSSGLDSGTYIVIVNDYSAKIMIK